MNSEQLFDTKSTLIEKHTKGDCEFDSLYGKWDAVSLVDPPLSGTVGKSPHDSQFVPDFFPLLDKLPDHGDLPPGSYLPFPRNEFFTGREQDLLALAHSLTTSSDGANQGGIQAITGPGGIGKTQLALEFCYRYGRFFRGVHWLHASSNLELDIVEAGRRMGLTPWPETQALQVEMTIQAWQNDGGHLIILDNLKDDGILAAWLSKFQGQQILVTSRRPHWSSTVWLVDYPLGLFPYRACRLLLRRLVPELQKIEDDRIDSLIDILDRLPLNLTITGKILAWLFEKNSERNVPGLYFEISSFIQKEVKSFSGVDSIIAGLLSMCWKLLKMDHAKRLFNGLGYLEPGVLFAGEIVSHFQCEECSESEMANALQGLVSLGLLCQAENRWFHVQPLLAEHAQRIDDRGAVLIASALDEAAYRAYETGSIQQFLPHRIHIELLLSFTDLLPDEVVSELLTTLGLHFKQLEENDRARKAFVRALIIDEAVYGEDHPNIARDVTNLGLILKKKGDYVGAKRAFIRALEIDERVFGPDHPKVAIRARRLGGILQQVGDYQKAKTLFMRALKIDKKVYGSGDLNVARDYLNLGKVLSTLGEHTKAKESFERALNIDKTMLGQNHPNIARDINHLGGVLRAQGDYPKAEEAFLQALRIDEEIFGPDHPNVARDINNLGLVYMELGDFTRAKEACTRAIKIDEAVFGPNHPKVARDVNNLGLILKEMGDFVGAKAAYSRALVIEEAVFGPEHPHVATLINNLGGVLRNLDDKKGARKAFMRSLAIDEAAFGPEHPRVAIRANNYGLALKEQGDYAKAKEAFERALCIDKNVFGHDHPKVAIRINNLGLVLMEQGSYAEARMAFKRSLKIMSKYYDIDSQNVLMIRKNIDSLKKKRSFASRVFDKLGQNN